MSTSFVDADAVLKDWYHGDKVHPQYIEATELLNLIKTSKEGVVNGVGGRQVVFPLRRGLTQGLGARASGSSTLPIARRQLLNSVQFPMKKTFARVQIDGDAWRSAMGNKDSFINLLREETNVALMGHAKDLNWQLFGNGTGKRGEISNVTIDSGVAPAASVYTFDMDDVRGFYEDMLLDNYDNTGVLIDASTAALPIVVTSVDRANLTITCTFPTGHTLPAATNYLYRAGNKDNELMGLDGIVNDASGVATLQGITVAGNAWWEAFVIDPGAPTALSLSNMELGVSASTQQNGKRPSKIVTSFNVNTKYEQLLVQDKRYVQDSSLPLLDGGYERLSYSKIPIVLDTDCQRDRMYFLQTADISLFHQFGYEWVSSPDKKNLWDRVPDLDAYEAVGVYEAELACKRRNIHSRLDNITV